MTSLSDDERPIKTGWMYKMTRTSSDIFVRRSIHLYAKGKFCTFHNDDDAEKHKTSYYLDKNCTIEPSSVDSIKSCRKRERPKGKWTITTMATGQGREIDLVSTMRRKQLFSA